MNLRALLQAISVKPPIIRFFFHWTLLIAIYFIAFGQITNALPKRLEWVKEWILPLSTFVALIVSLIATKRSTQDQTISQAFINGAMIAVYGAIALVIVAIVMVIVSPTGEVAASDTGKPLDNPRLSASQRQEVLELIQQQGYVSEEDLRNLGLNENEIQQVLDLIRKELANVKTDPYMNPDATCYIEPKPEYVTVAIRSEPDFHYHNAISYLARGEKVKVIGYAIINNQEGWWKIEINHGVNPVHGWVRDWPVNVSDQVQCNSVPRVTPY